MYIVLVVACVVANCGNLVFTVVYRTKKMAELWIERRKRVHAQNELIKAGKLKLKPQLNPY